MVEQNMKVTCPTCGEDFQQLAGHWYYNEDHRPDVDPELMEVLTGCMLGDANAEQPNENTTLTVYNTNKDFLKHIDELLGCLSKGVEEKEGGEWTHEDTTYYRVRTACHPAFNHFRGWYRPEKQFPEGLDLTPLLLKYWYVCDGNLQWDRGYPRVEIHSADNKDRLDVLAGWFEETPLPSPATNRHTLKWGNSASLDVLNWMGDPVPGFERKWKPVLE